MSISSRQVIYCFKQKHFFTFKKRGPNEFLYGLNYVKKYLPCNFLFANEYRIKHFLFKILEKIIAYQTHLGIHFQFFLNNKNNIRKNDILFAVQDAVGLGLLFFKLLRKINNKILIITQGLHDRYKYFSSKKLLIFFYRKLLNKADCVLTLSKYEKSLLIKLFRLNPKKVKVLYFGTDINYWSPAKATKNKTKEYLLTAGNDLRRDYDLLLNEYHLNLPLKIVSKTLRKRHLKIISNNAIFKNYLKVTNKKLRDLYAQAKFVIVPLKNTNATSGLSVTLQALAMEKPVLLTKTRAMQELFKDYQHVLYYEEGNPNSLKEKLTELNTNQKLRNKLGKNARKFVENKFNSKNTGKEVLNIIKTFYKLPKSA